MGVFCGPFVPYLIPAITEGDDCSSGGVGEGGRVANRSGSKNGK